MNSRVLVAIPALNAARTIAEVLSALSRKNTIVIDDGSEDDTSRIARELGFSVVRHASNLGHSAAIRTGEQYAQSNSFHAITLVDSDGQHPASRCSEFIAALSSHDFVVGDRFSNLNNIPPPKLASNLFASLLTEVATGIFMRDVSCGFRGYSLKDAAASRKIEGYGKVYLQVADFLHRCGLPARVRIPAIYDPSKPSMTRRSEVAGLCEALANFAPRASAIGIVTDACTERRSFSLSIRSISFDAQYQQYADAYVFETEMGEAARLYANP